MDIWKFRSQQFLESQLITTDIVYCAARICAQVSSGLVGLAITYALRLTDTLNQANPAGTSAWVRKIHGSAAPICGVFQVNRESADRETQMVSVERVHNYVTNVKQAIEFPLFTNYLRVFSCNYIQTDCLNSHCDYLSVPFLQQIWAQHSAQEAALRVSNSVQPSWPSLRPKATWKMWKCHKNSICSISRQKCSSSQQMKML